MKRVREWSVALCAVAAVALLLSGCAAKKKPGVGAETARALRRAPVTVRFAHRQWLALAVLGAAGAGCATQADVQFVREDVAEARKQAADAKAMVDSLKVDVESLRGEFETLKYQGA